MESVFEAFISNPALYSAGHLVGETLHFPTNTEEVQSLLKRIGVDGVRCQEYFIISFDSDILGLYDYLGEYENIDELNHLAHIPYTAQMIATLTRHQIGTVERALEIFRQLGLVEQLDSGAFYMTDIELMIGQSSTEAERKRAARLENKALLPPRTKGGHLSDIRPPEIKIELEKEIEKEREGETGHPAPAAYGRYNNVILTDTELSGLKTELPGKWEYYIDRLSCHMFCLEIPHLSARSTCRKSCSAISNLIFMLSIFIVFPPP